MHSAALEICVPAIAEFSKRKAYAGALMADIRSCAEELGDVKPEIMFLKGLPHLSVGELDETALCIKKSFDLKEMKIVAGLIPERTSTAVMTTLRNLRVNWYTMDCGSLNYVDLKALRGSNDLSIYGNLQRLFGFLEMNNFTVILYTDIKGETKASLQDSVNRAIELGAGAIELRSSDNANLITFGSEYLLSKGYVRANTEAKIVFALPRFAAELEDYYASSAEQYGMGCGAVTKLDGIKAKYTDDAGLYIANIENPNAIMTLI